MSAVLFEMIETDISLTEPFYADLATNTKIDAAPAKTIQKN
jgi:hypothetical protein